RQSDQAVGLTERGEPVAAARRAHRRDPAPGSRLLRPSGRRNPRFRRTRPAAQAGGRISLLLSETQNAKAAGFRRPFAIWNATFANFVAMQQDNCCHANKAVVAGIWYT